MFIWKIKKELKPIRLARLRKLEIVEMENGDPDRAIQAFTKSAEATKDSSLQSKAFYNLGQAFTKKGDFKSAAQSYVNAIEAANRIQDSALEEKSRKNLELLTKEQQKKQEQKQQQKNEEKQEKKEDKQQDSKNSEPRKDENEKKSDQKDSQTQSGEKKDEKQSEKQKEAATQDQKKNESNPDRGQGEQKQQKDQGSSRQGEEKRRQAFESKKMTGQDAERAISELLTQEKRLQEKLQKNRVKTQNSSKDW
jgi:hypothetical protein